MVVRDPEGIRACEQSAGSLTAAQEKGYKVLSAPLADPIILVYDRASSCLLGPTSRGLITPFVKAVQVQIGNLVARRQSGEAGY